MIIMICYDCLSSRKPHLQIFKLIYFQIPPAISSEVFLLLHRSYDRLAFLFLWLRGRREVRRCSNAFYSYANRAARRYNVRAVPKHTRDRILG